MKTRAISSVLFAACVLLLAACGTVAQQAVEPAAASFYVKPVKVANGYLIDASFRERYNALVAIYGAKRLEDGAPVFVPALERDFGVAPQGAGQWLMTDEAMQAMVVLSDLKRRGAKP